MRLIKDARLGATRRSTPPLGRGASLGLRERDSLGLVQRIRAGFAFGHLERFQKATGFSWEKIARLIQIAPRTLARKRQRHGRLDAAESERLLRIATIYEYALALFEGDAAAATRWLERPAPALAGEAPLELAATEIGAREVEDLIGRLEYGVFN